MMTRLELAIFGTGNRRLTIRPHHRVWIVLDFGGPYERQKSAWEVYDICQDVS